MSERWATNPSCLPGIETPVGPKGPVGDPGPKGIDPDTSPAPEDWRTVTVIWGGNVLRGSLVSLDLPEFDTLSLTLEDLDFSQTAFSGAALPDGDSP